MNDWDLDRLQRTDRELVDATLNGDCEAFGQLVERYERGVRAVIVRIVGDTHAAQDVAQEAFVKAYRNLTHLRRAGAFGPWLYRIARRAALSWLQQRPATPTTIVHNEIPAPSDNGRLDEASEQLLHAVMSLPMQERRVVLLRYFEGHAVRDIAEILDRPVGTVTKQLSRAHARLRQRLEAQRS